METSIWEEIIMLRNIDLDEISDGKLYTAGDLAKVGCQDCEADLFFLIQVLHCISPSV